MQDNVGSSVNNTEIMPKPMKWGFLCFTNYFKVLVFHFYGLITRNINIYIHDKSIFMLKVEC